MAALENKRYERFCQEYVVDYNGTQAAIRAGYSDTSAKQTAYKLLKREEVSSRIRELQSEQVKRLAVSQDYVVLQMLETYQCCREAHPVMEWDYDAGEMVETGKYQFDSKGALKALEMIGKHLGMFEKKTTQPHDEKSNLLDMLVAGTEEDMNTDDLPEVQ
jgi:phage terminase small subunit